MFDRNLQPQRSSAIGRERLLPSLPLALAMIVFAPAWPALLADELPKRSAAAAPPPEEVVGPEKIERLLRLGDLAAAEQAAQKAVERSRTAFGEKNRQVAPSLLQLAEVLRRRKKYTEAAFACQEAVSILEKEDPPDPLEVAKALCQLGEIFRTQSNLADAWSASEKALSLLAQAPHPPQADSEAVRAEILRQLATLEYDRGNPLEAERYAQESLRLLLRISAPETTEQALSTMHKISLLYLMQGRAEQALAIDEQALKLAERNLGPEHPSLIRCLNELCTLRYQQGEIEHSESLMERALAIAENAYGPDSPERIRLLHTLGYLYRDQGRIADAKRTFEQSAGLCEKSLGANHPDLARSHVHLGELYRVEGKYEEAERCLERGCAITENSLGPDSPELAWHLGFLALAYAAREKHSEAEETARRAVSVAERAFGLSHRAVSWNLHILAEICMARGRYQETESALERSMSIVQRAYGPRSLERYPVLLLRSELKQLEGNYPEAEQSTLEALRIAEQVFGPEHIQTAMALGGVAELARLQGSMESAEQAIRRALGIIEKSKFGPEHLSMVPHLLRLCLVSLSAQNVERAAPPPVEVVGQAKPLAEKAVEITRKFLGPRHPIVTKGVTVLALLSEERATLADNHPTISAVGGGAMAALEGIVRSDVPRLEKDLRRLRDTKQLQGLQAGRENLHREPPGQTGMAETASSEAGLNVGAASTPPASAAALESARVSVDSLQAVKGTVAFAELRWRQGKTDEAEKILWKALQRAKEEGSADSPEMLPVWTALGQLHHQQGNFSEAEFLHESALGIARGTLPLDDPRVSELVVELANTYVSEQKYAEIEELLRKFNPMRSSSRALGNLEAAFLLKGFSSLELGDYGNAEVSFREVIRSRQNGGRSESPVPFMNALYLLTQTLFAQGKTAEARSFLERLRRLEQESGWRYVPAAWPERYPDWRQVEFWPPDKVARAESDLRSELELETNVFGPEHPIVLKTVRAMAYVLGVQGRKDEAEPLAKRALAEALRGAPNSMPGATPWALADLGRICYLIEGYADAETAIKAALAAYEKTDPTTQVEQTRTIRIQLAYIYQALGKMEEAETQYDEVWRRSVQHGCPVHGPYESTVFRKLGVEYAAFLRNLGKPHRADEIEEEARRMLGP